MHKTLSTLRKMSARTVVGLVCAVSFTLSAAAFERSWIRVETVSGSVDVQVELAIDDAERAQGLQHRDSLDPDAGMLFDFGNRRIVAMWMKNTKIPLDMVFIDDDGSIVHVIENTDPFSTRLLSSLVPIRGVLELNAGSVDRLGIKLGDRIRHAIFGNGL